MKTAKELNDKEFSVYTLSVGNKDQMYTHWSKGLTMIIQKGSTTLVLNPEEIRKLVKSLPQTIGGQY